MAQILNSEQSYPSLQGSSMAVPAPKFVEPIPDILKCTVCSEVLLNAKQTNCGHRVCGACVDKNFASGQASVPCPLVGTPHEYDDCTNDGWIKDQIFPDNHAKKQVMKLRVHCTHQSFGCTETPAYGDFAAHIEACSFKPAPCKYRPRGCLEPVAQQARDKHEQVCRYRPMQCPDCSIELVVHEAEGHAATCPKRRVTCSDCKVTYSQHRAQKHQDKECTRRVGPCIYGCSFAGSTVEKMEEHYNDAVAMKKHLLFLQKFLSEAEDKQVEAMKEIAVLRDSITDLKRQCQDHKVDVRRLQLVTATNCDQLESIQAAQQQLSDKYITKDAFASDKANAQRSVQSLTERINSLERSQGSGSIGSSEISSMVQQHDRTLILYDVRLAEYDQRLQALDSSSYDGTLVWKIRDYRRRKLEAVQGRTLSIYSSPFYTSRFGYKSCARIYLNGDGTGKGHHVSLFFVVMKGEYDALLTWPFKQKVTLMLLDQTPAKKHLSDTFRPDPNSSSFQKPATDMNIASGCPQFVSHEVLEKDSTYLKEDTIFIRIKVDLEGL